MSDLTIVAVEPILLSVPFSTGSGSSHIAGRDTPSVTILAVRVETAGGLVGWGEAFAHSGASAVVAFIEDVIRPALLGRDARSVDGVMRELEVATHLTGRAGIATFALSGIDVALWDLAGKEAEAPLFELLGGSGQTLPAYASLLRCSTPQAVADECRAALDQGYRGVKLHEITVEAVAAARVAVGPEVSLMLDTNCAWSPDEAVTMCEQLRAFDLAWLEEPVWPPEDAASLARLRSSGIPIAAGENASGEAEFGHLFAKEAIDVAQPSVTKIGGVSAMMRIARSADDAGVLIAPHSPYLGPGLVASLHIAASLSSAPAVERLFIELEASPFGDEINTREGAFEVPRAPGLGVEPDPELLARYRVA